MTPNASIFEVELSLHDLDPAGLELLRTTLEEAALRLARQGVVVRCGDVRSTAERGCVVAFQTVEADSVKRLLEIANVPVAGARIRESTMQRSGELRPRTDDHVPIKSYSPSIRPCPQVDSGLGSEGLGALTSNHPCRQLASRTDKLRGTPPGTG